MNFEPDQISQVTTQIPQAEATDKNHRGIMQKCAYLIRVKKSRSKSYIPHTSCRIQCSCFQNCSTGIPMIPISIAPDTGLANPANNEFSTACDIEKDLRETVPSTE